MQGKQEKEAFARQLEASVGYYVILGPRGVYWTGDTWDTDWRKAERYHGMNGVSSECRKRVAELCKLGQFCVPAMIPANRN